MATMTETLRAAIEAYGSVYRVAKDSGVSQPVIARFMSGERDLRLATVERLAAALGLELRAKGKRK